jgi:O-acetyl-ADP-ribose deacetylase (regulator of RNase III)
MIDIKYVKGDATAPIGGGQKVICHLCNDKNAWGCGFVLALSKKWQLPELNYREWFWQGTKTGKKPELGQVQFVDVEKDIIVANMIAQEGIRWVGKTPPIRYEALDECLETVEERCRFSWTKESPVSVHMPRIGCGLAGGKWEEVEKIIIKQLSSHDVPVYVYDLV